MRCPAISMTTGSLHRGTPARPPGSARRGLARSVVARSLRLRLGLPRKADPGLAAPGLAIRPRPDERSRTAADVLAWGPCRQHRRRSDRLHPGPRDAVSLMGSPAVPGGRSLTGEGDSWLQAG